ncbi:MAG: LicD family protein, partial [Atopobiaceae bacterium]|nr:LicD family protein [Atopobiaceae bacterium]
APGFFYQCEQTEPDFHMTTLRLRLDGTTAIDMDNVANDVHQGLFIDIYPLYEVSQNDFLRLRQQCWAMVNCLLTIKRMPYNHGRLGRLAAKLGFFIFDRPGMKEHARRVMRSCQGKGTGLVANLNSGWISIKKVYRTEWMRPGKAVFEGRTVSVPADSDAFLTERYGDYMTLPPVENRKAYHDFVLLDLDTDYREYRGVEYLVR